MVSSFVDLWSKETESLNIQIIAKVFPKYDVKKSANVVIGDETWVHYEGRAKSSVTNRLPWFYPRYILKCVTALEWCVK